MDPPDSVHEAGDIDDFFPPQAFLSQSLSDIYFL